MSHSINDIARLSGVSIATVSRVINGRSGVATRTKDRVLKVMEETGYVPLPPKGRRGATARASLGGTILVMVPSEDSLQSLNGQALKAALLDEANSAGKKLNFGVIREPLEFPDLPPSGVLTTGFEPEAFITACHERYPEVPVVHLFSQPAPPDIDWVHIDHERIGDLAFDALSDWGAVAYVCLYDGAHGSLGRAEIVRARSFEHRAASKGVTVELLNGPWQADPQRACSDALEAIKSMTSRYDRVGIFCADPAIPQLHQALTIDGLDLLEQVRVACCDRHNRYTLFPTPIVIDCGVDLVAKLAINRLEERLEHPGLPSVRILVPPTLMSATPGSTDANVL